MWHSMLEILGLKEKVHFSSSYEDLTSIYMVLILVTYKPIGGLGNRYFITIVSYKLCNCNMSL